MKTMCKKLFFSIAVLFFSLPVIAQNEIKVKSIEVVASDLTARTNPRTDANGEFCALVRVVIPALKGMQFKGWVTGEVEYQPGEYHVYVPAGAKKITFMHENYPQGEIRFNIPIEKQMVYKVVLEVPELEKVYVSECSAMMAEGARLYSMRNYKNAREVYSRALKAKDVVPELKPTIMTNISQCDSCMLYERYATAAILKLKEVREQGAGTQREVAKYANDAIIFFDVLNNYNQTEYYSGYRQKLSKLLEDMSLDFDITLIQWIRSSIGVFDGEGMANVEVWAYYNTDELLPKEYKDDKVFSKTLEKSTSFKRLTISGNDGLISLQLDRKNVPTALLFRPVGYDNKSEIIYMTFADIMAQSKGNYFKRQFKVRIPVNIK